MQKDDVQAYGSAIAALFDKETADAYRGHHWAFAFEVEQGVSVFGCLRGKMFDFNLIVRHGNDGTSSAIKVGVAYARGPKAAADAIRKRLLPDALPVARGLLEGLKAKEDKAERLAAWLEDLKAQYPGMRGKMEQGEARFSLYKRDVGQVEAYARMGDDGEARIGLQRASFYDGHVMRLFDMLKGE